MQRLTQLFRLPKSTFYGRVQRAPLAANKYVSLRARVVTLFQRSRASAGQRTMVTLLKHDGVNVSRYTVRKIMQQEELHCKQRRHKSYRLTEKSAVFAPNLLNRQFEPGAIDTYWCGDVTYIWSQQGWHYLAAVMDLFSRKIVGFALSKHPDTALTQKALLMAFESRGRPNDLIFHSDQGCHYSSEQYRKALANYGITQSMSRRGNCWDNAPMERFFGSLKSEWIPRLGYENVDDIDSDIHQYIHGYYNSCRPHTNNNGFSPNDVESQLQMSIKMPKCSSL